MTPKSSYSPKSRAKNTGISKFKRLKQKLQLKGKGDETSLQQEPVAPNEQPLKTEPLLGVKDPSEYKDGEDQHAIDADAGPETVVVQKINQQSVQPGITYEDCQGLQEYDQ